MIQQAFDSLYQWSALVWPRAAAALVIMAAARLALYVVSLGVAFLRTREGSPDRAGITLQTVNGHSSFRIVTFIVTVCRTFFPGHACLTARPIYVFHRAVFHLAMAVSILFLSFHVYLWQESLPGWILRLMPEAELPDAWIEAASVFVILSAIWLMAGRLIEKPRRQGSILFDMLLYLIVLFPFLSGYCLMTGMETSIGLIDDNLATLHLSSGTVFVLTAGFLLCQTRIHSDRCIGCLACVNNCPTGALSVREAEGRATIRYHAPVCVHCGTCLRVCSDRASSLRHTLSIPFKAGIQGLCTVDLAVCTACHKKFAPVKHLEKLCAQGIDHDISVCPECRSLVHADLLKGTLRCGATPSCMA